MIVSSKKINEVIEYAFSAEDSDFFSSTFYRRKVVKDLLSLNYTSGKDKSEKRCYEGITYCNNEVKNKILKDGVFIDLNLRKHKLTKEDILLYYREKVRKNRWLCITYDNELIIDESKYRIIDMRRGIEKKEDGYVDIELFFQDKDNNVCVIDPSNFDISVPPYIYNFIEELLNLDQYEYEYMFSNPVCRGSFHEREDYFKLIIIFFCMNGGFNTKQIFHMMDLARVFGFSSKITEQIIKNILNLNIMEDQSVWNQILKRTGHRDTFAIDITYMVAVGDNPELIKYQILKKFSVDSNIPFERILYIYESICRKENIDRGRDENE